MAMKIMFSILLLATVSCIANIDESKKSGEEFTDSIQGVITQISNQIIPTAHASSDLCGSVNSTSVFATLYGVTSAGNLVELCTTDINPSTGKYNFKTKQSEIRKLYPVLKIVVSDMRLPWEKTIERREALLLPTEVNFNIDSEKSAVSKAIEKIDFAGFLTDPANNISVHRERYASSRLRRMFAGVFDSGVGTPTIDDLVNLENFFDVIGPDKVLEIKSEAEKPIPLPVVLSTQVLCSVDYSSSTSCFKTHSDECFAEFQTNFGLCLVADGGEFTPRTEIPSCVESVKEICTLHGRQDEYYEHRPLASNADIGVLNLLVDKDLKPFSLDTWSSEFYAYVHGIKVVKDCSACVVSGFDFLGCMQDSNFGHGCCIGLPYGCPFPNP